MRKKPNAIRNSGKKSEAFKDLVRYFILPLGKTLTGQEKLWEACQAFFNPDTRVVSSAVVKDTFKMPGLEELPGGKTKPIGNVTIFKGTRILFVLDK